MSVIQDYKNGPCRIIVYDDSIGSPEETEKVIERVSALILEEEMRKHLKEKDIRENKKWR